MVIATETIHGEQEGMTMVGEDEREDEDENENERKGKGKGKTSTTVSIPSGLKRRSKPG